MAPHLPLESYFCSLPLTTLLPSPSAALNIFFVTSIFFLKLKISGVQSPMVYEGILPVSRSLFPYSLLLLHCVLNEMDRFLILYTILPALRYLLCIKRWLNTHVPFLLAGCRSRTVYRNSFSIVKHCGKALAVSGLIDCTDSWLPWCNERYGRWHICPLEKCRGTSTTQWYFDAENVWWINPVTLSSPPSAITSSNTSSPLLWNHFSIWVVSGIPLWNWVPSSCVFWYLFCHVPWQ